MLNEHIELALRDADVHLFEIPFDPDVKPKQLEHLDGLDIAPEDHERVMREIDAFAREAIPRLVVEYRAPDSGNGRVRWRRARGSLVRDERGLTTHLVGSTQDITELKESQREAARLDAEEAQRALEQQLATRLKQVEAELRALNESFDLAVRLFDFSVTEIVLHAGASPAHTRTGADSGNERGLRSMPLASYFDYLKRVVMPEDLPRVLELFESALRSEISEINTECRVRAPSGDGYRWRFGRIKLYFDELGMPERCISFSHDIQPLKVAEEEAQRAAQHLRLATELSGVSIWGYDIVDASGLSTAKSVFAVDRTFDELGYDDELPRDIAGRMQQALLPADRPRFYAAVQDCLANRSEQFDIEYRLVGKDGQVRWKLSRGVSTRDATGRPLRFLGTSVDITQLKQTQDELQRVTDRLERALRASNTATWDLETPDGLLTSGIPVFHNAWEQCGYEAPSDPQLAAQVLTALLPPGEAERFMANVQTFFDGTGREWEIEQRVLHKDGTERWHLKRGTVERNAEGKVTRFSGTSTDISDRKQMERELQRFKERLELALLASKACTWDFEVTDGQIANAISVFTNAWQLLGHEMPANPQPAREVLSALLSAEDLEPFAERVQALFDGASSKWEVEQRVLHKDRKERWLLGRGVLERNESGIVTRFIGTAIDITDRKQMERELQLAKERLELAVLGSKACTWDFDMPDGQLFNAKAVFANAWELCGYEVPSDPEIASQAMIRLLPPENVERFVTVVQAFLAGTEGEWENEVGVVHKDGSERWLLGRGVAVRNENGIATRFAGTSIDITDRKRMEHALLESEERFRNTFENAAVGMILTDVSGKFLEYNRRFCEFLGYSAEELAGLCVFQFMDPDEAALHLENQERVVRGETPAFTRETRYFRKDGAVVWGNLTLSVIQRHADGTPAHVMGILQDITEHKALEATLELATRLSRVYSWSFELEDGKIDNARSTFVNVWESLGYDSPPDAAQFESAMTLVILPEDQPAVWAAVFACLEGRTPGFEAEYRIRHADGSIHWNLGRGIVARDASGRPQRFVGTSVDITELKRVQEEARKNKERLELAVHGSRVCAWDFDLTDGTIANAHATYTNVWLLGEYGADRSGRFADGMPSLVHPEERARFVAQVQSFLDGTEREFETEVRCEFIDGSDRWVLARGGVARDAQGRAVRFTGTSVDITDRKELEAEIRRGRETLELAMRGSDISVAVVDVPDGNLNDSRWTVFNFWEPTGIDPAIVPADFDGWTRLSIHPDDYDAVLANYRAVTESRRPDWYIEHRFFHADGSVRWRLSRGTILYDAAGNVSKFLATAIDITKLKQIESELSRAREVAEAANRAKDEFLANVSHEIRTPMNAILGMTELALDSAPSDHQRQLLSTVRSAAKNLLGIINDLLDFSKIAAGKLTLDRAPFSLRAAVGDTLRALSVRAHRKGLELLCHVQPEVPDALDGDAARLRQVLMNLVGNAVKFTQRGEIEVDVAVAPSSGSALGVEDGQLVFTVRDTGIGIELEKQATIFRAFEQGDSSTTRNYGGTGLGLTISAQLAVLMNGNITVESAPGHGSKFRFTARFARATRHEGATTSPERLADLRVLIVDDNETNRRILEEWLTSWRMQPTAVGNAAAAMDELTRAHDTGNPFALVLLDGRMPDVDGVTLAGQIRQHWGPRAPRLILLSSGDNPAFVAKSRANGVLSFLLKPVQQSELLEAIWSVMNLDLTPPSGDAKSGEKPQPLPSLHILVAEDNEFNVALLDELLRRRGHRAEFARDGRAALDLALKLAPGDACDLMLLDLHMPELDGFQVARAIREDEQGTSRHLPIIALTARSSARDRERCIAAGMDEFLSKPIEAAALWAVMERLVRRWSLAGAVSPRVESQLLDPRVILRACDGQPSLLEKIRVVFRQTLPNHLSRVRTALGAGDFASLREAAHSLAGTVGTFSTLTADIALTLEDEAIRQDLESCTALVERLVSMCDALLEETTTLSIDSLKL